MLSQGIKCLIGGITDFFVQLGLQKERGGAGKVVIMLNLDSELNQLQTNLQFLPVKISWSDILICSKGNWSHCFQIRREL